MRFKIIIDDPKQLPNIEAALQILDPLACLTNEEPDLKIFIFYNNDFLVKVVLPELPTSQGTWEYQDLDIKDPRYSPEDRPRRLKELIRLGIIITVGGYLSRKTPWGILSGVRPTKTVHHLRDCHFSYSEIKEKLLRIYYLDPAKADLLMQIAAQQEQYFHGHNLISLYIGIPFCPSRCRYCSFPAVSLETHSHLLPKYLEALTKEITQMGQVYRELGYSVQSIYIGGGTPTSIPEREFAVLLSSIKEEFFSDKTLEFTVEAGRPETLTIAKLEAMTVNGVNRVCINPQTMHDQTLAAIGRYHSAKDIVEAVSMARQFPQFALNMDLILGLPSEDGLMFLDSLNQVLLWQPENITIHTLAPKHAAAWRREFSSLSLATDAQLAATAARSGKILNKAGYSPYYLYRQRAILAQLENIGYTKPGFESIFNIQMMEERQSIIGLGAGAITKLVLGSGHRVIRLQNPKCPATYTNQLSTLVVKKAQQIRILLG